MADKFNMSDVMISYSRRNKTFVRNLDHALKAEGLETWVDWDDIPPTANWWSEIEAGIEGLVHVSELSNTYIKDPNAVVKIGDSFPVLLVECDDKGRYNLSKKKAEKK